MKASIIGIIMALFLLIQPMQAQSELDLYLVEAGKNNPGLSALFNMYLAQLEKIPQVGQLPDPQLSMAYFLAPVETRMGPQRFKMSAMQFFPWFGTLPAREEQVAQLAKAKLEEFEEAKSKLYHQIRSVYYQLFLTQKAGLIVKENIDILSSLKLLVLIKIESGQASSLDEIRLEIEKGDLENHLVNLQDQLETQWLTFDNMVNSKGFGRPLIPDDLDLDLAITSKSQLWEDVLALNHSLQKKDKELLAQESAILLAEKDGMPDFSVGMDYIAIGKGAADLPGTDAFVLPKINLTIPLFRDKYKAKVNQTRFEMEALGKQKENQINALEVNLETAYADYQDAVRRESLFQKQMLLAHQGLEILETAFSTDKAPFEEVLRMERKLLNYALELAKAKRDRGVSQSYFAYLTGN